MACEGEAALRKMKNGKEAGKDKVDIETLKAGDETIAKQLTKNQNQNQNNLYSTQAVHKVHNRMTHP